MRYGERREKTDFVAGRAALIVLVLAGAASAAVRGGDWPATRPAQGMFLVAVPRLPDPNFSRTVVLLTNYDARGAMGLVINRPTEVPISHAVPDLSESPRARGKVFVGGPVRSNALSLLVRSGEKPENAQHVFGDVYFSRSGELLRTLIADEESKTSVRVYAGYSGWGPGQLDAEIERGDWRVMPADADAIFYDDDRLWRRLLPPDPAWSAGLRPLRAEPVPAL